MKVNIWCAQHGLTKANYYYRLRRVREACLTICENADTSFVELSKPNIVPTDMQTATILHGSGGISMVTLNGASSKFIRNVIEALAYAQ